MQITCPHCKFCFDLKESKQRSLQENSYYWGVVLPTVSDHIGYTVEELHEIFKSLFLSEVKHIKMSNGTLREVRYARSTASLKVFEFEQYLENIRTWSALELGINIQLPNEERIRDERASEEKIFKTKKNNL